MEETRNSVIKRALEEKGISHEKLAVEFQVKRNAVTQRLNSDVEIDSIDFLYAVSKLTGYSLEYFISRGKGLDVMEPTVQYGIKRVPFFDVEATGGNNGSDVSPVANPTSMIDMGDTLRDAEAAIRMAGNSMMPGYPPGSVLGIIPKRNKAIVPGEVYVYEVEDGRHVKRLFFKDDDPGSDTVVCYSDTTTVFETGPRKGKLFYPPYEIKLADIKRLFIVTGVVKRNTQQHDLPKC